MASHLTLEERERIAQRRAAGKSRRAIAEELGRGPSSDGATGRWWRRWSALR